MYARKPHASEDTVRTRVFSDSVRFLSFPVPLEQQARAAIIKYGTVAQLVRAPL